MKTKQKLLQKRKEKTKNKNKSCKRVSIGRLIKVVDNHMTCEGRKVSCWVWLQSRARELNQGSGVDGAAINSLPVRCNPPFALGLTCRAGYSAAVTTGQRINWGDRITISPFDFTKYCPKCFQSILIWELY